MTRSPYLRDRLAEMPVFRNRERPLPMSPEARCSRTTAAMLPERDMASELRHRGTPTWIAAIAPVGFLSWYADDSIPDGIIEIDGTRITLAEMRAATEGP